MKILLLCRVACKVLPNVVLNIVTFMSICCWSKGVKALSIASG